MTSDKYEFSVSVTNGGDADSSDYFTIFGFAGCEPGGDVEHNMNRLRRAYIPLVERGALPDPLVVATKMGRGAGFSLQFPGRPGVLLREEVKPLLELFGILSRPEARLFVCHASEDKPIARKLTSYLIAQGADVWLDEVEIRVGESIVEKVNSGLEAASHLVVLLSRNSVDKPWVKRELSAALMRQLSDRAVTVLPVRLDDSLVPTILSDIKYADCRVDAASGFQEIANAVFPLRGRSTLRT